MIAFPNGSHALLLPEESCRFVKITHCNMLLCNCLTGRFQTLLYSVAGQTFGWKVALSEIRVDLLIGWAYTKIPRRKAGENEKPAEATKYVDVPKRNRKASQLYDCCGKMVGIWLMQCN